MAADRETRLRQLFAQLAPLPVPERNARLDAIGNEDLELHDELCALLEADERTSVLDDPIGLEDIVLSETTSGKRRSAQPQSPETGSMVGPYRVIRPLGAGGMGQVYLAAQTAPVHRQVAIKIVHAGPASHELLARFEVERQALALLESPHVARILDVGTATDGRAFFALEYVDGIPITEYCDRHKFTLQTRLRLFLQVCKGIEDAHQRGVIHRDIKPTNILVGGETDEPFVKVIDFGIAKVSQHPSGQTMQGVLLGTPDYMSPEQAESGGRDVDTRSDVYSAGLVLFELLVGDLPHDRVGSHGSLSVNPLQHLAPHETPRPSDRVSTLQGQESCSLRRGMRPPELKRELRGELDWICLRALERDRTRRYQGISELAADIRRYLAGEPVLARPPSLSYRVRKLARRHRGAVLATSVVVLALLGATIASSMFYVREQHAHGESRQSALRAEMAQQQSDRAVQFLRRVLVEMNSAGASGEPATLDHAIGLALAELENAGLDPRDAAGTKHSIATILNDMKFRSMAKLVFESALRDFAVAQDASAFDHATCLLELASLRTRFVRDPEVTLDLAQQALQLVELKLARTSFEAISVRMQAVQVLVRARETELAEHLLRESVELFRSHDLAKQREVANARHTALLTLAQVERRDGRFREALELLHEAEVIAQRAGFDGLGDRILATKRRASLLLAMERNGEAAAILDSTVTLIRRLREERAISTALYEAELSLALAKTGRYDDAQARLSQAIATCAADPACASAHAGPLQWFQGELHRLQRRWSEAAQAYARAQRHFDVRWPRGETRWHTRVQHSLGLVAEQRGSPSDTRHASAEAPETGFVRGAGEANKGFMYGRVATNLGDTYEGFLRWGSEETFWGDLFHATKEQLPYLELPRPHDARGPGADSTTTAAHWKALAGYEMGSYSRILMARFGDIARIEPEGDDRARVYMKSGEIHDVVGGTNDVSAVIYIQDIELGDATVEWRHVDRIEFMQAPSHVSPRARRLYGTVHASGATYEGHIHWDNQECLDTDVLNGRSQGSEKDVVMGHILSIERMSRRSCKVVLDDGRELELSGTNDVGTENRGITVEDPRFGRVAVPWWEFIRVEFAPAPHNGRGYDEFDGGRPLYGAVIDVDGNKKSGRLVFDLDEASDWEMLNGFSGEIMFEIPFSNVASIGPAGPDTSTAVLRSGEVLRLHASTDVTARNEGILVIPEGPSDPEVHIEWMRVERVVFWDAQQVLDRWGQKHADRSTKGGVESETR